jgi:hypothetical protein
MTMSDGKENKEDKVDVEDFGGVKIPKAGVSGPIVTSPGAKSSLTYVGNASRFVDPTSGVSFERGLETLVNKDDAERLVKDFPGRFYTEKSGG